MDDLEGVAFDGPEIYINGSYFHSLREKAWAAIYIANSWGIIDCYSIIHRVLSKVSSTWVGTYFYTLHKVRD